MSFSETAEFTRTIRTGRLETSYQRMGSGEPVLLLHGSGAGVSAWSNWRLIMPELAKEFDVIAPDLAGFGRTRPTEKFDFVLLDSWLDQVMTLLDGLGLARAHVIGNSFGGAVALAAAARHSDRFNRIVLMGTAGVRGKITRELDELWGYQPSRENMRKVLSHMIYDHDRITEDLIEMRYQSTLEPGVAEQFASLFPTPRQRHWDAMVTDESVLRGLNNSFLLVHGRDDRVCPLWTSLRLLDVLQDVQLTVFSQCGHWVMIEQRERFVRLVMSFLKFG